MADALQLLIKSAFDATGITAATNSINSLDRQINQISRAATKFMGLFAAGGAGIALFNFSKRAVDAFAKEERAIDMRNKALINLGITDRAMMRDLDQMAEGLERTTSAQKEDVLAVQTSLIQRGLYGAELQRAIPTVMDLATKTGSLSSAADMVGKAFQGVTRGLNTVGVIIPANTDKTKVYAEAMRQLNEMYSGAAQAEMQNTAGKIELLGKRFDDLTKRLGELLSGPAGAAISWFESLATILERLASPNTDRRLQDLYETLNNFQERLKTLKGPKTGFFDWWDRSPASIKMVEDEIKKIQGLINQAEKVNKPVSGGSTKPTRPVGALYDDDADRVKAQKKEEADAKSRAAILEQVDDFSLSQRGQLYARFFGATTMAAKRSYVAQAKSAEDMKDRQKKILRDLENDYEAASHTFSGGFKQAVMETEASLWDFNAGFNSAITSAVGPAQEALKSFFNMSSAGFLNIGTLAEKTFKGIMNAFYDMITQMIAKYLVFQMVTGMGLGGTAFGKFLGLSLSTGGPIPGPKGAPMPILAHGGEFMLSANVVEAIKAGRPTSGLSAAGAAPSAAGGSATIYQTFQVSGGGNIKDTLREIATAARRGTTEALDAAKVLYKQGAKRSGETAL